MTTAQDIANYVNRKLDDFPRAHVAVVEGHYRQRPTALDLAREFMADAEFEALNLGQFLSTPDGQLIRQGVQRVSPPFIAADAELISEALVLAAKAQQRGKRGVAMALTGVATILFIVMLSSARSEIKR